ncbi:uncharacterized protein LOC121867808 [Homarus americanus]|uniref:uncharacterized protein LOC121867808 n=1 Tax=Homarus americanus TaxID=6706 RepID=UPI001C464000|nr:uncharacterized protein LOC121867808 [Homarus americanus]
MMKTKLPQLMNPEITELLKKPYLLRTRVAQRKLGATLQEPLPPPLNTTRQTTITTCPLLHLQQLLEHLSKTLGFMLSMLPQSLEELEEAMWNDPIQYNFFREDGRVILDVNNCVECYAKDPTGKCRELFFCKGGETVYRSMFAQADRIRRMNG